MLLDCRALCFLAHPEPIISKDLPDIKTPELQIAKTLKL
jgi:hypothetical protein